MPSGLTTTTALSLITGVGVVYSDVSTTSTKLGATAGPPTIKELKTWRNIGSEIDGVTNLPAGLDLLDRNDLEASFTLTEVNARVLALLNPGSTAATVSSVTTVTPIDTSTPLVKAQYTKTFRIVWRIGVNGTLELNMPLALCTSGGLGADNRNIGKLPVTMESRLDLTASGVTTDSPSFSWILTPST